MLLFSLQADKGWDFSHHTHLSFIHPYALGDGLRRDARVSLAMQGSDLGLLHSQRRKKPFLPLSTSPEV